MCYRIYIKLYIVFISIIFWSCHSKNPEVKNTVFTSLKSSYTGIDFENKLTYDKDFNIYTYRNFYNGGGVAIGDINNDGLPDIFFSANMLPNRLYLNKGNFKFEDVTEKAGIFKKSKWSTGVSMADVNGDGFLDIYVCNSGNEKGEHKENELYINNGPAGGGVGFTERAKEYGLDDKGYSTHAAFFDYDKDGDLDMYLLNNSFRPIGSFNLKNNERTIRDSLGGDKLYRNDNNYFTDVSAAAGIYGSIIGFGLGVIAGDINKDGWQDIYVCNDHFERDYLYINNKNGTFTEDLENEIGSISNASMGADLADINNDNLPDIFTTEMLPATDARIKTNATFENWDKYQFNLQYGYYHQFTRNALQLNNGPSVSPSAIQGASNFSEISRLAGVQATDWSWGTLIADLDNDGWKDIFVANGIYQDITNQDYIQYISSKEFAGKIINNKEPDYKALIELIPSNPISNYAFINEGNLHFTNRSGELGLDEPGFSNGSAYGDLDNDGDLDLVVNNVNMRPFVYRNETTSQHPENKFLRIKLKGDKKNAFALGTQLNVYCGNKTFYQEQMPTRGYQSTVDNRILFGLGKVEIIDSVVTKWPDGKVTVLKNIKPDQEIILKQSEGTFDNRQEATGNRQHSLFVLQTDNSGIDFIHKENEFADFDRDPLIFHMLSREGPAAAMGDVNGDGIDDIYIGGAKGQPGVMYLQSLSGNFKKTENAFFVRDKECEDVASVFFDADGDGDNDLYVCSGGNEFSTNAPELKDRLYINDGKGLCTPSPVALPSSTSGNSSCVAAADYDGDGDQDIFVGQRLKPLSYGIPANGCLLQNNGKGVFTDVTSLIAPSLLNIGMITSAAWIDYDNDNKPDLVIAGEYMPVTLFHNDGNKFKGVTNEAGFAKTNGWWNRLAIADVNSDGYPDIIAGNHGLNSRFKSSVEKPLSMYVNDFDDNGTIEQIVCQYNGEKSYPMILRHDLVALLPSLKGKYLKYDRYKEQTIDDIFTSSQLKKAIKLEAYNFESSIFLNNKNGTFTRKPLPIEAQFSPVYAINYNDLDGDGKNDLLVAGNFYEAKPEVGIYDANYGLVLKGDGKGSFTPLPLRKTGITVKGEVRNVVEIKRKDGTRKLIFILNNQAPVIYKNQK
jgi:hypothetical protein